MKRVCLLALLLIGGTVHAAENWPGWRGPRGDGSSQEQQLVKTWDGKTMKNIAWKAPIPGVGHGSPIIWKNHVLLVTCLEKAKGKNKPRKLVCLDRRTGKVRWQQTVVSCPLETKHSLNSRASSTPATDGKTIYVTFLEIDGSKVIAPNVGSKRLCTPGRIAVAAYDMNGKRKWIQRVGDFVSAHGFCSNPVIYKDLVILNGDHDGNSYVLAIKSDTGKVVWRVNRRHKTRSYVTPLIRKINGQDQLVFSGSLCIISLDPKTGKRLWNIEGPTEQYVASMVYDGNLFFMAAGYPTYHVMGIDPRGRGDVSKSHVKWHKRNVRCYVPSPVVVGNYLIVADDRGTANCFDTRTGERYWQKRMGNHFSASLITANKNVYLVADNGTTKIVAPGEKLKVVATNKLGEYTYASPAISHGCLFIRGEKHLYCIGSKQTSGKLGAR